MLFNLHSILEIGDTAAGLVLIFSLSRILWKTVEILVLEPTAYKQGGNDNTLESR